jgi:hypothetical protein
MRVVPPVKTLCVTLIAHVVALQQHILASYKAEESVTRSDVFNFFRNATTTIQDLSSVL